MIFRVDIFFNARDSNEIQNVSYLLAKWLQGISYFLEKKKKETKTYTHTNPQLSSGQLVKPSMAISSRLCDPLDAQSSSCLSIMTTSIAYTTRGVFYSEGPMENSKLHFYQCR